MRPSLAHRSSHRDDSRRETDDLLAVSARLTEILVGGTTAAVPARQRLSNDDADFIVPEPRGPFDEVFAILDSNDDPHLVRATPPVVVRGNFHGVGTTLRQLIRIKALETEVVETPRGSVLIPTLDEMIRVKAWLILTRNAYRDYLDLAALSEIAGTERTLTHSRDLMSSMLMSAPNELRGARFRRFN